MYTPRTPLREGSGRLPGHPQEGEAREGAEGPGEARQEALEEGEEEEEEEEEEEGERCRLSEESIEECALELVARSISIRIII